MKRLSKKQEIEILQTIANTGSYLSRGSSRAVYELDEDTIVKVALDKKGQYQNGNEIKLYRNFGHEGYLAEIYAYGKHIVLMERVEIFHSGAIEDELAFHEGVSFYEGFEPITSEEGYERIAETLDAITSYVGWSQDNYQIGLAKNGKFVVYDYGYTEDEYSLCVSYNLGSYINFVGEEDLPLEIINFILKNKNFNYKRDMKGF